MRGTTKGVAGALLALTALAPTVHAEESDPELPALTSREPVPEPPSAAEVAQAKARIGDLNRRLHALQRYVRTAPDRTQSLDLTSARAAGHDHELLLLATELVGYQNALLTKARQAQTGAVTNPVLVEDYPEVRQLFSAASRAAVTELRDEATTPAHPLDLRNVNPCGDWLNPLPAAPVARRLEGPYAHVQATLLRAGYHHTAGHACGHPNRAACASDFTRGRVLTTGAGTCQSPRFRDQAIPSYSMPGYVRVQYGEPNPEFEAYAWPYWTWAAYVIWWHRNY